MSRPNIYSEDHPVTGFLSALGDLVLLNLVFVFTGIWVITAGPAVLALYGCALKLTADEGGGIVRGYLHLFRKNFLTGLVLEVVTLVTLAIAATFFYLAFFVYPIGDSSIPAVIPMVFIILGAFVILTLMLFLPIWVPLLARFDNSIMTHVVNAIKLTAGNFFTVLLMWVGTGVLVFGPMSIPISHLFFRLMWWLCLGFALIAYVHAKLLHPIFKAILERQENLAKHTDISAANSKE